MVCFTMTSTFLGWPYHYKNSLSFPASQVCFFQFSKESQAKSSNMDSSFFRFFFWMFEPLSWPVESFQSSGCIVLCASSFSLWSCSHCSVPYLFWRMPLAACRGIEALWRMRACGKKYCNNGWSFCIVDALEREDMEPHNELNQFSSW